LPNETVDAIINITAISPSFFIEVLLRDVIFNRQTEVLQLLPSPEVMLQSRWLHSNVFHAKAVTYPAGAA
jgi:hypothetical protein